MWITRNQDTQPSFLASLSLLCMKQVPPKHWVGVWRAAAHLRAVQCGVCPGACPQHLAEPFPCVLGTEQCLFRLWEKRLCKQQSVDVVTSPLKIASLYLFSYPLCFHHLLPPTLIAPMPELLFLRGCCRHKLKQTSDKAAQECPVLQSQAPGKGIPVPCCCSCLPELSSKESL